MTRMDLPWGMSEKGCYSYRRARHWGAEHVDAGRGAISAVGARPGAALCGQQPSAWQSAQPVLKSEHNRGAQDGTEILSDGPVLLSGRDSTLVGGLGQPDSGTGGAGSDAVRGDRYPRGVLARSPTDR
jgi:hypothetical protein